MKKVLTLLIILSMMFVVLGCQKDEKNLTLSEYKHGSGWSFQYPASYDQIGDDYVQESSSGKTLQFRMGEGSKEELEAWIDSEILRKLLAEEADNSMVEPVTSKSVDQLTIYRYTLQSKGDGQVHMLKSTMFHDGNKWVELHTAIGPMTEEEYNTIVDSFNF
ncbi:hypothetical protein [Alkaliphilus transvaalensis]|uniref:hypothetical protein n=1 Tax=Alkaliphilus transvaalensis TaxID=114628 RepID=UPI00047CA24A|nr:hypothetical protein [Alkaliphilus transvaalensis]